MQHIRAFLIVLSCVATLAFGAGSAWADAAPPKAVVESFQADLLEVMKSARGLDVRARYDRLLPAVHRAFGLRLMVRIAAGKYWDDATPAQRDALVQAFTRMNIATVATLFDGFSGQVFEVVGEEDGPQNTRMVRTRIVNPDRSSVKLVYRMILVGDEWRIIDVIVDDGISEVQVRRSEYAKTLADGGIERLTAMLAAKAKELVGE